MVALDAEIEQPLPLKGVKVLALENYVAGPVATMLLADWGADVLKIEPPRGDAYRSFPPIHEDDGRRSNPSFVRINRNKRSRVVDLKTDEGVDEFLLLAADADVIVENLRPGSLDRLGIGYSRLREVKADTILVSLSGFGQPEIAEGPLSGQTAFDLVGQAVSGLAYASGTDDDPPQYLGFPLVDTATADWGATATLLALMWRDRTGQGQHVDVSMYDVAMHLNEYNLGYRAWHGEAPPRGHIPSSAPFGYFRAKDGWFALAISGEQTWQRLCDVIDRPDLAADETLANGTDRAKVTESRLRPAVEDWTSTRSVEAVLQTLKDAGVPASTVHDLDDVFECEHAEARGAWVNVPDDVLGPVRVVANPVKSSSMPPWPVEPAPVLGEN